MSKEREREREYAPRKTRVQRARMSIAERPFSRSLSNSDTLQRLFFFSVPLSRAATTLADAYIRWTCIVVRYEEECV